MKWVAVFLSSRAALATADPVESSTEPERLVVGAVWEKLRTEAETSKKAEARIGMNGVYYRAVRFRMR